MDIIIKIIFGTTNTAKIKQMQGALAPLNVEVVGLPNITLPNIAENGETPQENARVKALAYAQAIGEPIFSMDNALYLSGLSDQEQPGTHVRRINNSTARPSDSELLAYYTTLINKLGDRVEARWEYAACFAWPSGKIKEMAMSTPRIFVNQPSEQMVPGYPLESIQIDPDTGKYISEMPREEQDKFWQKTIGKQLCHFIAEIIKTNTD